MIEHKPIDSSNIVSAGYDAGGKVLEVKFKSGGNYRHEDVSQEKYDAFMAAPSKGSHYHANIRGQHKFSKVDPE